MSMNASGWTPRAPEAAEGEAQTWTGNRALMLEEALIFEMDCESGSGVDLAAPGAAPSTLPDALLRHRPDRTARPVGAGDGAPLYAPQPPELCDRSRAVPARLVHDEAQSAAQREDGAAARLCGHHPLQPQDSVQGALELIETLASGW
jgi:glycine dehydrogenase subunit 2